MSATDTNGPSLARSVDLSDITTTSGFSVSPSCDQEAACDTINVGGRLRILVAGRTTAGKTTLLRRVCGSSYQTGSNHPDVELPHPSFIFHDSAGFLETTEPNIAQVKTFLRARATATKMSDRVHAIWYCVQTDTNMYLSPADKHFFSDNVAEDVPVIVVFTKYDGLVTKAFGDLRRTLGRVESKEKRFEKAREWLDSRYIEPLKAMRYPPLEFVRMDDLSNDTTSVEELIQTTLKLLSGDTLRPMLLSVRQNNLDACAERAVLEGLDAQDLSAILPNILPHYPHSQNILACSSVLSGMIILATTWTHTRRAEVVAAVCICVEQTFTQASASMADFPSAFSKALEVYVSPDCSVRISVNKEIAKFSPHDYREIPDPSSNQPRRKAVSKLVEIIKIYRLRVADDSLGADGNDL
ncbi:hypothetical protein C8F01DRAFT_1157997 [Mycena amicta]|nr:hypothetical protein C8F01DRAFT_1157997 [Mycena amicta]